MELQCKNSISHACLNVVASLAQNGHQSPLSDGYPGLNRHQDNGSWPITGVRNWTQLCSGLVWENNWWRSYVASICIWSPAPCSTYLGIGNIVSSHLCGPADAKGMGSVLRWSFAAKWEAFVEKIDEIYSGDSFTRWVLHEWAGRIAPPLPINEEGADWAVKWVVLDWQYC